MARDLEYREHNTMEEVNCIVLDALKEYESIRILGDIPTGNLHSEDYLASTQETISTFASFWNGKANLRLFVVEVWPRHTYFALDFNNDKYDFDNAHVQVIVLPVCLLRLSRRSDQWKYSGINLRTYRWLGELQSYMKEMGRTQLLSLGIILKAWYTITLGDVNL